MKFLFSNFITESHIFEEVSINFCLNVALVYLRTVRQWILERRKATRTILQIWSLTMSSFRNSILLSSSNSILLSNLRTNALALQSMTTSCLSSYATFVCPSMFLSLISWWWDELTTLLESPAVNQIGCIKHIKSSFPHSTNSRLMISEIPLIVLNSIKLY